MWYQRPPQENWVRDIATGLKSGSPIAPIYIAQLPNGELQVVDGKQRTLAAREARLGTIPAVIVPVKSENEAAAIFVTLNSTKKVSENHKVLSAKNLNPAARAIFKANTNENSNLYQRVRYNLGSGESKSGIPANQLVQSLSVYFGKQATDSVEGLLSNLSNASEEKISTFLEYIGIVYFGGSSPVAVKRGALLALATLAREEGIRTNPNFLQSFRRTDWKTWGNGHAGARAASKVIVEELRHRYRR